LLAALFLAGCLGAIQPSPRPVAATDCVTYYCATMTVAFTGNGYVHAVDDQGGIDCYWNAGSISGVCTYQYYWIGQSSPTLPITITVTATANSYACWIGGCSEPGGSVTANATLQRSDTLQDTFGGNLAKSQTTTVGTNSNGSGKITSSPAGLNCTVSAGTNSGTCTATWYFRDSLSVTYTATPASDSAVCELTVSNCGAVGQARSGAVIYTFTGSGGVPFFFLQGHPIVTVGVVGQGTVVSSPSGISCPSSCSKYFAPSTNLTLNAAAKAGYVFQGWTGACAGYGPSCNVTLGSTDATTTATFAKATTPTPTPHATPLRTPTATSAPGATVHPGPSAQPTTGIRSSPPGPSVVTPTPGPSLASGSIDPGESDAVAIGATIAPTSQAVSEDGPTSSGEPVSAQPAPATGVDPVVVLLLIVIALLVLALGFALGTRRGRAAG
jgi:uncharacterized repeat protein (TIGR02543 family)